MHKLVGIMCLLSVTVADAGPLQPKRPTGKFSERALRSFVEGLVADRAGNIHHAFNAYRASLSAEPQATTYFNLAELSLRLERTEDATKYFKLYLEHAADAPDRAAIARLLEELATAAPVITIGGKVHGLAGEEDALVLVDGIVVGRSPVTIRARPGRHEAERITATTYAHTTFSARAGTRAYVTLNASGDDAKRTGNVVISGVGREQTWREGTTRFASHQRFKLAPGRYTTKLDRSIACSPIEFDVKSEKELTYVHVVLEDGARGSDCRSVQHARVQRLKVTAP